MSHGEAHAELGRHAGAEHHRLGVVAVDVQDRRLDRFRHVGAIEAGIGVRRHGGEADLVVDDDMHRAAGAVADELAHRQRLVHQALAGERGVAVHQDRHHRARAAACRRPCPGARAPCRPPPDRPLPGATGWAAATDARVRPAISMIGRGAEVVFHVAGALHVVGLEALAAEFARTPRSNGFFTMLTSVLSRPRCGMPMAISLHAGLRRRLDDGVHARGW